MTRMPKFLLLLAVAASLAGCSRDGGATADDASVQDTHRAHGADGAPVAAPPNGQLWPTDEPLRAGMARIQVAIEQASAEVQPLSRDSAGRLAGTVEENVAYIVKNCRLPPEPDAALHVLIGRLMNAANQLKAEPAAETAVSELDAILRDYRSTFDDAHTAPAT